MPTKNRTKTKTLVTLTHPSGRFEVEVSEARAATLEERGYTRKAASKPAGRGKTTESSGE